MCLATTTKRILTAKRDIIVEKYGYTNRDLYDPIRFSNNDPSNYFISDTRGFKYKFDKMYSLKEELHQRMTMEVDFLYFDEMAKNSLPLKDTSIIKFSKPVYVTTFGFHSAKLNRMLKAYYYSKRYLAIIPKGAKYIKDKSGLYVSDKIKMLSPERYEGIYRKYKLIN